MRINKATVGTIDSTINFNSKNWYSGDKILRTLIESNLFKKLKRKVSKYKKIVEAKR